MACAIRRKMMFRTLLVIFQKVTIIASQVEGMAVARR